MLKYKTHMEEKVIINARKINKMRFISGIAISSLVIIMTFVVLLLNLIDYYNHDSPESGVGTLRMFTTLSNIVAAFAASMCLPFQIDGLRRDRYKLPSWIVIVMYIGAVGVFLTFSIAITLISSFQGFSKTMLEGSNLFLHSINPILITALFVLVVSDSKIKFSYSFFPMIPIVIYMFIYFLMVFILKEWRDVYKTDDFIPWYVTLILLLAVSFGICQLLRFLHNLSNKHVNKKIEEYYMCSPDFDFPRVSDAIAYLAKIESKFYYENDDVYIPADIIQLLSNRYSASIVPVDILYDIYLENYLLNIGKKSVETKSE